MNHTEFSYSSINLINKKLRQTVKIKPSFEIIESNDAYGRILYTDIFSNKNIPYEDSSHMDGFAVISRDLENASSSNPVYLKLVSNIELGDKICKKLKSKQCMRIATGGYLPKNSDAVVPIEYTQYDSDAGLIKISTPFMKGSFITVAGNEIKKYDRVFRKNTILRIQDLTLLSLLGIEKIKVLKRPVISIIPTGNELTEDVKEVKNGKILNTNSHIISKLISENGGNPIDLGITSDNVQKIKETVYDALSKSDIVITIGGTSKGEKDFVKNFLLSERKVQLFFHGIKLDRGRVGGVAVIKNKPIVMLPGPIQGALNGFIVFILPMIRSFLNLPEKLPAFNGILMKDWYARKKYQNFTKIIYVKATITDDGKIFANPVTGETSDFTVLTKSNGFVIIPERTTVLNKNRKIKINLIPGLSYTYSTNVIDFLSS